MSDTTDATIAALRNRLRELELDAVMIRGRVEELTATLEALEAAQKRRGRPRLQVAAQASQAFQATPWAGSGHDPKDAAE